MPHETDSSRGWNPKLTAQERVQHQSRVLELSRKRVMSEAFRKREVARVVHATAAEVVSHGMKAGASQALSEGGEHPPVLEALEAVQNHHCRAR
jgi:hypothetical protein